jgi:hypothetical protein
MNRFIWRIKSRSGNWCQAHPSAFFKEMSRKCAPASCALCLFGSLVRAFSGDKDAFSLFETIHIMAE